MSSKYHRPKIGKAQCKHKSSRKGVGSGSGSNTCEACREAGNTGQGSISTPNPILPADKKRKKGASDTISDSEASETSLPISSNTLPHELNNIQRHSLVKKRRVSKLSASRPLESRRKTSRVVRSKSSEDCGICTNRAERREWKNKMGGKTLKWFRCEMKTCKLWYHSSCVFVLLDQDPQSMLFCPGPSSDRAIFICPKCINQPEKGYDKAAHQAMKAFISTYETVKRQDIEKESSTECPIHILSALEDVDFELAREEKYNGLDDNLVNSLVRNLHQSIFDYDIEMQSDIDRFAATSNIPTQTPLAAWQLVDVNSTVTLGHMWFHTDEVGGKRPTRHAHITTALRTMLGIPDGDPLRIASNLTNLTFSQVHTGLVSWFVFDVIDNRIDIYGLPNMTSMRAMMTAVASTGEARWPGKGRHVLQEVQLRTWYKSEFQQTLLLNRERFKQRLEAFLKPLTKDFDRINSWSDGRGNIIETTLRLWSYLQSLQGRLVMIQPAIGDPFDSKLHDAYDQEGLQLDLGKNSKKKILWILCRGFQFEEGGMEDPLVLTIKARVIVQ